MARSRKPSAPTPPSMPTLAPEQALRALKQQLDRGERLIQDTDWTERDLDNWSLQVNRWVEDAFGESSSELVNFQWIGRSAFVVDMDDSRSHLRRKALENHKERLNTLTSLIQILEDRVELLSSPAALVVEEPAEVDPERLRSVFVVHGHDNEMRLEVCLYLEKLGMNAIVLFEQVNLGRTIIEKLEEEGNRAGYALVLVSPDDVGGKAAAELQGRPRQNVVFELGLFIGKLGRKNVCLLKRGDIEILSDIQGLVYHTYESDWRVALVREMKAAGMDGNWGAVFD